MLASVGWKPIQSVLPIDPCNFPWSTCVQVPFKVLYSELVVPSDFCQSSRARSFSAFRFCCEFHFFIEKLYVFFLFLSLFFFTDCPSCPLFLFSMVCPYNEMPKIAARKVWSFLHLLLRLLRFEFLFWCYHLFFWAQWYTGLFFDFSIIFRCISPPLIHLFSICEALGMLGKCLFSLMYTSSSSKLFSDTPDQNIVGPGCIQLNLNFLWNIFPFTLSM